MANKVLAAVHGDLHRLAIRRSETLGSEGVHGEGVPDGNLQQARHLAGKARQVVQVGERVCDYNETFELYLCT